MSSRAVVPALLLLFSIQPGACAGDELPLPAEIKGELVLIEGNGARLSYNAWPEDKKRRLAELYEKISKGEKDLGIHVPSVANIDKNSGRAFFTAAEATDVFLAHVAHCLYVEEKKLVPWSLKDYDNRELESLFDAARYYASIRHSQSTGYPTGIEPGRDFMEAPENDCMGELDSDPRIAYDFVTGKTSASRKSLVGKDQLETLATLTVWLRDNLGHASLDPKEKPKQPWLVDRLRPAHGQKVALAAQGCHSAAKLLVDLARSINIPLLHVRTQEKDVTDSYFFNRTHGGLIYAVGRAHTRILWHADEIYAMPGEPCFPVDKEGALLSPVEATRAYFDHRWLTQPELTKAGFVFKLEKVVPDKGWGVTGRGAYEDRTDLGWMAGYWKCKGASDLSSFLRAEWSFALGGDFLLNLAVNKIVDAQLTTDIKAWQGGFDAKELPTMHTIAEYEQRANVIMKALGGEAGYKKALAEWESRRGSNLMK